MVSENRDSPYLWFTKAALNKAMDCYDIQATVAGVGVKGPEGDSCRNA